MKKEIEDRQRAKDEETSVLLKEIEQSNSWKKIPEVLHDYRVNNRFKRKYIPGFCPMKAWGKSDLRVEPPGSYKQYMITTNNGKEKWRIAASINYNINHKKAA